jgi:hypothetical protein
LHKKYETTGHLPLHLTGGITATIIMVVVVVVVVMMMMILFHIVVEAIAL